MPHLILRGAWLAHVVIQNNEAGVFCRLNMRADFSEPVREEMGWQELGMRSKMMDLEGELPFGCLILQSQQQMVSGTSPELRLQFEDAGGFRAVRVKDKDQESTRVELRFHIRSNNPDAAALCQAYKRDAKQTLGDLRIVFSESGSLEETEVANVFAREGDDKAQMTIAEGMKVVNGNRGKKRSTRRDMSAAMEPTVTVEPDERERLDRVIEESLAAAE